MRYGLLLLIIFTGSCFSASNTCGCTSPSHIKTHRAVIGFDRERYIVEDTGENNLTQNTPVPQKQTQHLKSGVPSSAMVFDSEDSIKLNNLSIELRKLQQNVQTLSKSFANLKAEFQMMPMSDAVQQHETLLQRVNELESMLQNINSAQHNGSPDQTNTTLLKKLEQVERELKGEVNVLKKSVKGQSHVEAVINETGLSENFYILVFVIAGLSGMLFGGISAFLVFHYGFRKKQNTEDEI